MSLLGIKKYQVGIDIGPDNITLVGLLAFAGNYELRSFARLHKTQVQTLEELFHTTEIQRAHIRVGIRDARMRLHRASIPKVPENEIYEMIQWSVREHVKNSLESYTIRYYWIKEEDEKQVYWVYLTEREAIANRLAECKKFGVPKPSMLIPDIQALSNLVSHHYMGGSQGTLAVLDIGLQIAQFFIVSKNGIIYHRFFSSSHMALLLEAISSELNLPVGDAQQAFEQQFQNLNSEQSVKIQPLIAKYLSKLSVELLFSIENYQKTNPGISIDKIILSGEGNWLGGLKEMIFDSANMQVENIHAFLKINTHSFDKNTIDSMRYSYAISTGLAL